MHVVACCWAKHSSPVHLQWRRFPRREASVLLMGHCRHELGGGGGGGGGYHLYRISAVYNDHMVTSYDILGFV